MARLTASSVNVSMPQSVWWIRMISRVPSSRLADRQRADLIVGDYSPGIADHVRLPSFRPKMR